MNTQPSNLQLSDYEAALRSLVAQLLIMYRYNGGDETQRIVIQLLREIHRLSPYLEELVQLAKAGDTHALLDKMKPIEAVIQEPKEPTHVDENR